MRPTKGYIVLAAAVVMQLCLGGIYAWSEFTPPLQANFGFSKQATEFIFGTCICVFTLSLLVTGPLQDRLGPRPLAMASGVMLSAGYLVAGFWGDSLVALWLGVGVLNGVAIGLGYVCPVATAVKWFPRRKGLVTGLAVAGYGGSAILLSQLARLLLLRGWSVLEIFRAVGVVYGLVVLAMGALMFLPGPIPSPAGQPFRRRQMLVTGRFWSLSVTLFCSAIAGLIVISQVKPIGVAMGHSAAMAALAISVLAVGNGAGRIVWGFIYDRLEIRTTVLLSLAAMAGAVTVVAAGGHVLWVFLLGTLLVGFCYGGNFGIYAPETARLYGVHVMGSAYPLVLLSHGIAAVVGPSLAGRLAEGGNYRNGMLFGVGVALLGLVVAAIAHRRGGGTIAVIKDD